MPDLLQREATIAVEIERVSNVAIDVIASEIVVEIDRDSTSIENLTVITKRIDVAEQSLPMRNS